MADIITRSIPAIPYQGGTPRTAQPYSAAVQLTPTRMVWTYCQTNPDWRFFVIVDTPEGWAKGGTPAVTVSRMQDQRSYKGISLHMARLNDNAFVIFDANVTGTETAWAYEVFEIDSNNVFTRTATNVDAYGNVNTLQKLTYANVNWTGTSGTRNQMMSIVPMADNQLICAGWLNSSAVGAFTIAYNPTSKVMTFNTSNIASYGGWNTNSVEVLWRSIPGSTKKAITFRGNSGTNVWAHTAMFSGTMVINPDNSMATPYITTGAAITLGTTNPSPAQDMVMMSDLRAARTSWNWIYYHGYAGGNLTNDGFGSYTSVTSTNPQMAFALDANYLLLMDRTHFQSSGSGPIKMKIIRRDDANMVAQSPGSAVAATGFDVTAPWIETWRHDPRPRQLANGDLFWWGLDASGALAWNILKNAA